MTSREAIKLNDNCSNNNDDRVLRKLFFDATITMALADLSGSMSAIADAVLTGQVLGNIGLAARGLGSPYYSIVSVIGGLLMVGSITLCTTAIGKGDQNEFSKIYSMTLTVVLAISCLLGITGFCFPEMFSILFGAGNASPEVFAETTAYIRGLFPATPAFTLFIVLTSFFQIDGDSFLPRVASLVCAVTNVLGDLLSLYVFKSDMFGMGLATSFSYYAAMAVMMLHFKRNNSILITSFSGLKLDMIPSLLKGGWSRAVCMLSRAALPIILNVTALRLGGDTAVTALSVQSSVSFILMSLGWGIGEALLLVGGMMGVGDNLSGLKIVLQTAIRYILAGVLSLSLLSFIASPLITRFFITDPGTAMDLSKEALQWYSLSLPLLAVNVSFASYCQLVSKDPLSYIVNLLREAGSVALMALILSVLSGIRGLFIAFPAGQLILMIGIVSYLLCTRDNNRQGVDAYLMLPESLGGEDDDHIDRSVSSVEEAVELSKYAFEFCLSRGVVKKTAYRLSLCIEELCTNVIEHGFSDGKPHFLNVRVLMKDGKVVLRTRDDGSSFNLKERADTWKPDPEKPEKNLGIRFIMASANDIAYTSCMGTNNLIITIDDVV